MVNFRGAVDAVAVPAFNCRTAEGPVVPIPTLPPFAINSLVLPPVLKYCSPPAEVIKVKFPPAAVVNVALAGA